MLAVALSVTATVATAPSAHATEATKPKTYTVVEGDYLEKIAKAHKITWKKLWDKNLKIGNPDYIQVGDKLVIPAPEEKVKERQLTPVTPEVSAPTSTQQYVAPLQAVSPRTVVPGNGYTYGYCTWYVKNRRADIGNFWGDAHAWYGSAQAAGYATGRVPQAGAIGVDFTGPYGHVVYVESVNGNGTVNISEMNYRGYGVISTRTTSASEFFYIY